MPDSISLWWFESIKKSEQMTRRKMDKPENEERESERWAELD